MKKILLLFAACCFLATVGYAQTGNDLTGPKAKNHKSWKDSSEKSVVVFQATDDRLTGPKAKNRKTGHQRQPSQATLPITTSQYAKAKLKGPKAKNYKAWRAKVQWEGILARSVGDAQY